MCYVDADKKNWKCIVPDNPLRSFIDEEVLGNANHPAKRWASQPEPAPKRALNIMALPPSTFGMAEEIEPPPPKKHKSNRAMAEFNRAEALEAGNVVQAEAVAKANAVIGQLRAQLLAQVEESSALHLGLRTQSWNWNSKLASKTRWRSFKSRRRAGHCVARIPTTFVPRSTSVRSSTFQQPPRTTLF